MLYEKKKITRKKRILQKLPKNIHRPTQTSPETPAFEPLLPWKS